MSKKERIKLGRLISNDCFLPENLSITARQFNYWRNCNVLPFFLKEKKGYMNMSEALWILIINELSNIGVNSKKLQSLSNNIWVVPFEKKYADGVFKEALVSNNLDLFEKKSTEELIKFDPIMNTIFRKEINPFTDAFKSCLISNRSIVSLIYCPKTGEHSFNFSNVGLTADLNNLYFGETLIVIPFLPLISKLVGIEIGKSNTDLEYLSSVENQIRRVLFFDKPKLLEIEVQQDDSPKIIKITEEHKKPEELAKFFLTNKLPLSSKILIEPRAQGNYKITIRT
jgi:hypothetical protein